jgi:hypothetical protein
MSADTQNTPRTELVSLVRFAIGLRRGLPARECPVFCV